MKLLLEKVSYLFHCFDTSSDFRYFGCNRGLSLHVESKASEHSARMVAMKNATDKSRELVKALTITFNMKRQAAITAEVSEITAGVEAMK